MTDISRVQYSERQFLGASDFRAEQVYHRDGRRRHALGSHTWGIVVGLDLTEVPAATDPTEVDVILTPGVAIDGYGRELVAFGPMRLDAAAFEAFIDDAHRQVWLANDEVPFSGPADGFADCEDGQPARVSEGFRLVVDPTPPPHDDVMVDGLAGSAPPAPPGAPVLPVDESVPYQELPASVDSRWLVRLGDVRWDGNKRVFRPAAAGRLANGRRYAGSVADHVLGPNGVMRLAPRTPFADADAADFATVEGRLRVEGRVNAEVELWMEGQPIRFTYDGGSEEKVPLTLGRVRPTSGAGHRLRVKLGDSKVPEHRFAVGRAAGAAGDDVLEVAADDVVHVSTGTLSFGKAVRQMIDLWSDGGHQYGLGVQSGTLYARTGHDFCWFRGGTHAPERGNPGGGNLVMKLDDSNLLTLFGSAAATGDVTAGSNGDGVVRTRHVVGKQAGTNALDALHLNWNNGFPVVVGNPGGNKSELLVSGRLRAFGDVTSVLHVWTKTQAIGNNGPGLVGWNVPIPAGEFTQVDAAFAVLQGFSLWDNNGNTAFTNFNHAASINAIPQHVFVRVTSSSVSGIVGESYCSESKATLEGDNTVLFTVVVIGRRIT